MTATDPGWHRPGGSASQTTTHSCSLCVVLGVPTPPGGGAAQSYWRATLPA